MEEIIRRLTELTARQMQFSEQLSRRQDATEQMIAATAAARIPLPDARSTAHFHLTKLSDQDDVEAYLHIFEVIATREAWDKSEWARILAPFLTGEAQRAYYSLQAPASEDYEALKREILARVGLSPVTAAQQFQEWMYNEAAPIRAQVAQLTRLTHLWLLTGEPTASQVAEKVMLDRLLRALPRRLRGPVSMRNPSSLRELVESIELAEASIARDAGQRAMTQPRRVNRPWRPPEGISQPVGRPAVSSLQDEPMPTEPTPAAPRAWLAGYGIHRRIPSGAPERRIRLDGQAVTAVLDSGSSVTLVQSSVIRPRHRGKIMIPITCVHGDTRSVPARRVTISAGPGAWPLEVGIMEDLPVPVLLGRDWPGFDQLLTPSREPAERGNGRRRRRPARPRNPRPVMLATDSEREGDGFGAVFTGQDSKPK
ncbi:hypothetical protein IRJ41_025378 [Triplophysa rosa]|uniref:SCAN box domain-containing protein n=1 Tax=Triplophysa rosa TaxID=992332 RepID=A0A9W7X6P9_TRIRA|nr:hypothetical protein IRJ41_025378 [Triplophysa rosa]